MGLPSNFLLLRKAEAVSAAVRFEVARVLLTEDIADLGGLALLSTKEIEKQATEKVSETTKDRKVDTFLGFVPH